MTTRARSPRTIGDYVVLRELGRGGMGAVYLAQDPVLDRKVAIKVIAGYRDHPGARARFLVEARAVARLSHPNVVAVFRAGEHDGEPYLVAEYIDGVALDQVPRPLAPDVLRELALGLARGLAAAHKEGILHRDVKPGNAIVGKDGTVKLLDFGLAKLDERSGVEPAPVAAPSTTIADSPTVPGTPTARTGDPDATRTFTPPANEATPSAGAADAGELTQAGSRMGTPRYMPPEAWRGERLTAASDVFSLGLVLWELIAGRHPLAALEPEALPAAAAHVPSLTTAGVPVRPALARVIDRAVAADPAARPADAGALVTALVAAFDGPDEVADDPAAARANERPSRAVAAMMIAAGGAAVAGVAWVARPRGSSSSGAPDAAVVAVVRDAGVDATPPTGEARQFPSTALTTTGACASEPVFIDAATLAYSLISRDEVDLYTLVPGATPERLAGVPGAWDWRPKRGRNRGEVLYSTDGPDGSMRIHAVARASGAVREVLVGYEVGAVGDALFVLTDDDGGKWVHRRTGATDERVVETPGSTDRLAVSDDGKTLALVLAEPGSTPQICLIDVATRGVRCVDDVVPATAPPSFGLAPLSFGAGGQTLYVGSTLGVYAIDVASATVHARISGLSATGGVAVSPDGRVLVYSDCRSYGEIVAVGTDAVAQVLVEGGQVRSPVAMPGGGVAYLSNDPVNGIRLIALAVDGAERVLASDHQDLGRPAFSTDGERVAYARGGRGVFVQPLAGGDEVAWTTAADARTPLWQPDGGLVYARTDGTTWSLWSQASADAAPVRLVDGWRLQDVRGDRLLLHQSPARLAWYSLATGAVTPIRMGELATKTVLAARALPDGAIAALVSETSSIVRLDPRTAKITTIYAYGIGQTAQEFTVLGDGRIAVRLEVWLGELYQLSPKW